MNTESTTSVQNERFRTFAPIGAKLTGYEVFQWPEFQAFADRLGIPLALRTTGLSIEIGSDPLEVESPVRVSHSYMASDTKCVVDAKCGPDGCSVVSREVPKVNDEVLSCGCGPGGCGRA